MNDIWYTFVSLFPYDENILLVIVCELNFDHYYSHPKCSQRARINNDLNVLSISLSIFILSGCAKYIIKAYIQIKVKEAKVKSYCIYILSMDINDFQSSSISFLSDEICDRKEEWWFNLKCW